MIKRIWRLITAFFNKLIGSAEQQSAGALYQQALDERVQKVAAARTSLGDVAGTVKTCTREVSRLEGEQTALTARKNYFLKQVKQAGAGTPLAVSAKAKALDYHRQLTVLAEDLNRARNDLAAAAQEFETSKSLIKNAEKSVQDAKRTGRRREAQLASAQRSADLADTRNALQGLGGVGDELARFDSEIQDGIDSLQGAALVANEIAEDALAEQRLDLEIASEQADADFNAELAALEADDSEVAKEEDIGTKEATPVPRDTAPVIDELLERSSEPETERAVNFGGGNSSSSSD